MSEQLQQAQILDVHVAFLRLTEPDEASTLNTRLLLADACEAGSAALRDHQTPAWLPISTAPKDGTWMLLCDEADVVIGRYIWPNEWEIREGGLIDATHWMALPCPFAQAPRS